MSLEDDLKAKTLALISQQMANWVVEIQRHIGKYQESLVRSLDELQETVARYDERINESDIENSILDVVSSQPPPVAAGPDFSRLKASLAEIEKGGSLSEVLTYLVNEASQYVDRAVMFIAKGSNAIGWYSRGVEPADAVKQVNVPLGADTVLRHVQNSKRAMRGHISHVPGTAQALARLGGNPQGVLAVPLMLRDKLAAILYCDSTLDEIPAGDADLIEILVVFAGKNIDMLSAIPKGAPARTTSGTTTDRAAAIRSGSEEVRERAGVPPQRPAAPPPPPAPAADEGSSTVMFNAAALRQQAVTPGPPPRPAAPPPAPTPQLSPEEQKAHEDAKRFARLVVSEIKLYNESKVNEGRRQKNIYERLKEDIERGRQMYSDRVPGQVRDVSNYFYEELVRILAGGDASALGPM